MLSNRTADALHGRQSWRCRHSGCDDCQSASSTTRSAILGDLAQLRQLLGTAWRRAFPLCASSRRFYGMCIGPVAGQPGFVENSPERPEHQRKEEGKLKKTLKRIPLLGWFLKTVYACWREFRHCLRGYRFLRAHDLVIVSGGGQLNEEWGGPWSHPFSLFKWAVLARIAGVPYVVASVGVGKVRSKTSRLFLRSSLRMARYRSYRDKNSKAFRGDSTATSERRFRSSGSGF